MNNQIPNSFGPFNNNCRCRGDIIDLQRRFNQLENRVSRLENRVFGNNWGNFGGFNSPSMMNTETREYTTGNYIL